MTVEQQGGGSDLDLRRYAGMLLRWWWLFVVCTVLAAGTSYYVSRSMTKVYEATTTLIVGQALQSSDANQSDVYASIQLAKTYSELLRGPSILQGTIDQLGLRATWRQLQAQVSVQLVRDTQLIRISVKDFSPEWARRIADEIAAQLIEKTPTSKQEAEQAEQRAFVQEQLADLKGKIAVAQFRLDRLETDLAESTNGEAAALKVQADALRTQIYSWRDNYAQLLAFVDTPSANYLSIVEPATVPVMPVSPKTQQNVLLAAVVGLMVAGGVALVIEYLDDSIKSVDELTTRLGLTALGAIVKLHGEEYPQKLISHEGTPHGAVEGYRMLRSNIQFVTHDKLPKSLLITSPGPAEGKSITAANLAIAMAQAGQRVILVDCDMRRPVQHHIFEVPNETGLSTALRDAEASALSLLYYTGIDNLWVLPCGPVPSNAAGLVSSPRMQRVMEELQEHADLVILDSPPVLSVADTSLLANRLDGTVLVTDVGNTSLHAAQRAVDQLKQAGANMLGGVLNRFDRSNNGYYYYYYASDEGDKHRRKHNGKHRAWWEHVPLLQSHNGKH